MPSQLHPPADPPDKVVDHPTTPPPPAARDTGPGEWFRTLAETTTTAIFVYDAQRFLYANPACERLTGYTAAELLARGPVDVVHPDYRRLVAERAAARVRGEEVETHYELRLVHQSGRDVWVDFTAALIQFQGRPAGLGTAFDITQRKQAEDALRESQGRLALAQHAAGVITWEWEIASDRLLFSDHARTLLGLEPGDLGPTSTSFFRLVHPQDRERLLTAVRQALRGGEEYFVEHRILSPRGRLHWLAERGLVLRDESGRAQRMLGVSTDITARKLAEEALFREKERAQVTLASIADGVIRTDTRGIIDYLNPAAERATLCPAHQAVGRPLRDVFRALDPVTRTQVPDPLARSLHEGRTITLPGDRLLLRPDGTELPVHESASPLRDRDGGILGAVLVFEDLSAVREMEREMTFLASHDPLTGLPNRSAFEERLDGLLTSARERGDRCHALCYLDLDLFKLVNDTCGHLAGDELLKQVAARLATRLPDGDTLARLGGDEFGVLLPDSPLPRARAVAEELRRVVEDLRFQWQDRQFAGGVSIGLVPISSASTDRAALLAAADAACYVAKERGGNRVHEYSPGDSAIAERHGEMQWIQRIHQAFEKQRFRLFQQEIRPLAPERGLPPLAEILVRMLDEHREVVPTNAFIAAAERYHLIPALDHWVVRTSFSLLAPGGPARAALPGAFTLNLSGQSLGDVELLRLVVHELRATGLEPDRICFEITETAVIANLGNALRFISALKALGCRFVLDDFGTGFSSFAYLKSLPVDFLKIAKPFVQGVASDPIQRALVESIQQLARVMGMRTIAEGVEDEPTRAVLAELGVDYAQGYLLARPRPLLPEPANSD